MRHLASTSCSLVCASSSSSSLSCSFSPSFSSSVGSVEVFGLPGEVTWRGPTVLNRSLQCSQPRTLLCALGHTTHACHHVANGAASVSYGGQDLTCRKLNQFFRHSLCQALIAQVTISQFMSSIMVKYAAPPCGLHLSSGRCWFSSSHRPRPHASNDTF